MSLDLTPLAVGGVAPQRVPVSVAAQLMGVSHWTVRRWINTGALPARKMPSGGLSISVRDLEVLGEPVVPPRPRRPA
jgi:hypothetical protein